MQTSTSTDGVTIAIHDLGGDGPPILFAHATGFCGPTWEPVARHLTDHRCFALDFRAHGCSTRPADGNLAWEGVGEDVLAVVDHLGLSRPFGVGHSMGGAALLLAEESRPSTFRGIWGYEPIVIPTELLRMDGGNTLSDGAARRRETFPSVADARGNFASKPPMASFHPDALDAYVRGGFEQLEDGSVRLRCRAADESAFYLMGGRHHAGERLGEVRCPVTVLRGAMEPGPAAFAQWIVDHLPDARLEAHDELDHFGPMVAPAAIAESIRTAIAGQDHPGR